MKVCRYSVGGWERVEAMCRALRGAPQMSEAVSPVAVLDADGTIWEDDIGEDMFEWLAGTERLKVEVPPEGLFAHYKARVAADADEGYAWMATQLAGFELRELEALCMSYYREHYASKVFEAQAGLIDMLHREGWDVWAVSASPRWMVQAGVLDLGIPFDRVLGIETHVEEGKLTDRLIFPITSGEGKVEAIKKRIGRRPALAVGNSMGDFPMLCFASEVAITINPSEELQVEAQSRGWLQERW